MASLYRNYRPQTFGEVVNQDHVITTLKNAVSAGTFAHAYLFTGPRGTGKTSVARILARAVNCPNQKNGEPCNTCPTCVSFVAGNNLDLIEIDAASNTGVENVREIIEHLRFSPSSAKFKVFIVDEVHMLSKGAFNALLKTLEEPPKHAFFVLATTEIHKVPATIISRTQRFDFQKIGREQIFEHLKKVAGQENIKIDDPSLQLVASAAEGGMRDALSILDKLSSVPDLNLEATEQLLGLTNVRLSQGFFGQLIGTDATAAINYLENLFSSGVDPVQFNKDFLDYLRNVLLFKMGSEKSFVLDEDQLSELKKHASTVDMNKLLHIIRLFMKANKDFSSSPYAELPLEIATAECMAPAPSISRPATPVMNNSVVMAAPVSVPREKPVVTQKPIESKPVVDKRKVEPEPIDTPVFDGPAPDILISQQEVVSAWPQLLQEARKHSSSLFTILQHAKVKSVEMNAITFTFPFKFHKDSIDNVKNKSVLTKTLTDHFKTPITVFSVWEQAENKASEDASEVAMDVFGEDLG